MTNVSSNLLFDHQKEHYDSFLIFGLIFLMKADRDVRYGFFVHSDIVLFQCKFAIEVIFQFVRDVVSPSSRLIS